MPRTGRSATLLPTLDRAIGFPSTPIEHCTDTVSASRAFAWKVLFAPREQRNPDPMCSPVACTGTSAAKLDGLTGRGWHRSCSVCTVCGMKIFSACGALITIISFRLRRAWVRDFWAAALCFILHQPRLLRRLPRKASSGLAGKQRGNASRQQHTMTLTMLSLLCPAGWLWL